MSTTAKMLRLAERGRAASPAKLAAQPIRHQGSDLYLRISRCATCEGACVRSASGNHEIECYYCGAVWIDYGPAPSARAVRRVKASSSLLGPNFHVALTWSGEDEYRALLRIYTLQRVP